jgi:hypothetical protein
MADEGMWLFNRLPVQLLSERHGFEPTAAWAQNVMRSCVRLSSGGSGSIVSARGLVMTNHHVVSEWVQELSSSEHDYVNDGFFAKSIEEELRCPATEMLVLWEIDDVTARVQGAVPQGVDPGAAEKARRAEISRIEAESKAATGFHSEVVTLYRGGEYHIYRYKRFDDVRLVFVPETRIAFFGGDADNFEFPRHCLDVSFVRLYENGKPASTDVHVRFAKRPVAEKDLIFVAGHPGRTQRLNTVAHLTFYRDTIYPRFLRMLYRREIALQQFSLRGDEARRLARDDLFGIQNSRKALRGIVTGLLDPAIFARKRSGEAALQAAVAGNGALGADLGDWARIDASLDAYSDFYDEYQLIEGRRAFWSELAGHARTLVRLADELPKPSTERLPEFRDSALPLLRSRLLAEIPLDTALESAKLTDSFIEFAETMGAEHPLVRLVLDGKPPADRAWELVSGTTLRDVKSREALFDGGAGAIAASTDPMIVALRSIEPFARALRDKYERLVQGVQTEAYARIAKASFAVTGNSVYPDATFTLRLAFGVVRGWREADREIPAFTRMSGALELSDRVKNADPYELPESWISRRDSVSGETHFNFVSTADIIGGNSGSPVLNRNAEVVGLIFDGNIHGLVLDIGYTEEKARAVSVDTSAILEALRSVYGMNALVDELTQP